MQRDLVDYKLTLEKKKTYLFLPLVFKRNVLPFFPMNVNKSSEMTTECTVYIVFVTVFLHLQANLVQALENSFYIPHIVFVQYTNDSQTRTLLEFLNIYAPFETKYAAFRISFLSR